MFAGVPLELLRLLFLVPAAGPGNVLLTWPSDATADAISAVQRVIFVAAVFVMLAVLVKRWLDATAARRRALTPAVAGTPLFVIAGFIAVDGTVPEALLRPLLVAFLAAPVALLASMLQARLARSAVADLVVQPARRPHAGGDPRRVRPSRCGDRVARPSPTGCPSTACTPTLDGRAGRR